MFSFVPFYPLSDLPGFSKWLETSGQQMLTQGVASRPAALADQPLHQAEEQQGPRVVWSPQPSGRPRPKQVMKGGGQRHWRPNLPRQADSEVSVECSQGRRDSRLSSGRQDSFSAASCSPSHIMAPSSGLTWSPLRDDWKLLQV